MPEARTPSGPPVRKNLGPGPNFSSLRPGQNGRKFGGGVMEAQQKLPIGCIHKKLFFNAKNRFFLMEKNCSIKFALFLTVMWELKRKLLYFSLFEWNRLKAPIERRPGRFIGITPQGMEYGVSSWYHAI